MTGRRRTRAIFTTSNAVRLALGGVAVSLSALVMAGQANADTETPTPAPGQPVVEPASAPLVAAPPPTGAPTVPEIPNPQYGQGSSPGALGFLRDAWHQAQDPYGFTGMPEGQTATSTPPAGAGPAPPLPPGYISTNAPGSETAAAAPRTGPEGAPALPPGYYSTSGPPPPGYYDTPIDPFAPPTS